jgi:sigma-B regulation protein RsbU (phosphoserine phosphatase)
MAAHALSLDPQVSELPRLIDWVETCCGADGVSDETRFKMMLALEEAVSNVIKNAFDGVPLPHRIEVRLDISATSVVAEVVDNGHPFDPTAAPDPDLSLPLEERHPGGLGILLMRRVMDRLQYRRSGGSNILRLEKRLD